MATRVTTRFVVILSVGMVIGAIEEIVEKPLMWRADLSVGDTWLDGTTGFSGLSEKQFDKQRREGVSCINSGMPDFFEGMGTTVTESIQINI